MDHHETMPPSAEARVRVPIPYVDWAAVLGGAVIAAAIAGLFTTFGAALGLSTLSAEPGEGSFGLWAVVTALWIAISLVASYYAGGYVAGRMRRRADDATADEAAARDGVNGLVVWGLGTILSIGLAAGVISGTGATVGTAVTATGSAIGGVAQGAGALAGGAVQGSLQGAAQALGALVSDEGDEGLVDYLTSTLMRPTAEGLRRGVQAPAGESAPAASRPAPDDATLAAQSGMVLGQVLKNGEIAEEDRAFLIAAVASRSGRSEAEVTARVDEVVDAVKAARDKAAIAAAETARQGAILTAFLMTAAALVAAAAALVGGVRGGRHRDEGRIWGGLSFRY